MGNWIPNDPTSFVSQLLKISSTFTPPPPEGFISPMTWGVDTHIIERFGQAGVPKENISMVKDTFHFTSPDKSPADLIESSGAKQEGSHELHQKHYETVGKLVGFKPHCGDTAGARLVSSSIVQLSYHQGGRCEIPARAASTQLRKVAVNVDSMTNFRPALA